MVCFAIYFYNHTVFQKFERSCLYQVVIDPKKVITFQKCPLTSELKLKIS